MPEYIFYGRLVKTGVQFFITAENEEEAKDKARAAQFDRLEDDAAENVDWTINPKTCVVNE